MAAKKKNNTKAGPQTKNPTFDRKGNNKSPDIHPLVKTEQTEDKVKIQTNHEQSLQETNLISQIKNQQTNHSQDHHEDIGLTKEENTPQVKTEDSLPLNPSLDYKSIDHTELTEQPHQQHLTHPEGAVESTGLPAQEIIQNQQQPEQPIKKEQKNSPLENISLQPQDKLNEQQSQNNPNATIVVQEQEHKSAEQQNIDLSLTAFYSIQESNNNGQNIEFTLCEEDKEQQTIQKSNEVSPTEEQQPNINQQPNFIETKQQKQEFMQIQEVIQPTQLPNIQLQQESSELKDVVSNQNEPVQQPHLQHLEETQNITLTQSLNNQQPKHIQIVQPQQEISNQHPSEIEHITQESHLVHPIEEFALVFNKPNEDRVFTLAYSEEIPISDTHESIISEPIEKQQKYIVMKQSISFSDFNCSISDDKPTEPIAEEHIKKNEEVPKPTQQHQQLPVSAQPAQIDKQSQQEVVVAESPVQSQPQVQQEVAPIDPQPSEPQQSLPVELPSQIQHFQVEVTIVEPQISQVVIIHQTQHNQNPAQKMHTLIVEQQPMFKSSSAQVSGIYISSQYQVLQQSDEPKILMANLTLQQSQQLKSQHEHQNDKQTHRINQKNNRKENQSPVKEQIPIQIQEQSPIILIKQQYLNRIKQQYLNTIKSDTQLANKDQSQISVQYQPESQTLVSKETEKIANPHKQEQKQNEEKTPLALRLIQSAILGTIAAGGLIWHKEYNLKYVAVGLAVFAGTFFVRK